jgi:glycosyltransferase involved in cell wall biosynthesis
VKISIVTLSFNQHAYLREAIESVLGQEYRDLEYIVVDPGSSDSSRETIQNYSAAISQTVFEPDRGPSDGLNKGFSRATGEVLGFLNADDLLLPGSLQKVADFFAHRPNCDLAFGNGFIIDGEGRRVRHVRARDFTVRRYLLGGARFLQQSTFFRRAAFIRTAGFNLANRTSWDGELFLNMVKQGVTVGYIDADLAAFRIHSTSISGSGRLLTAYREDCRRIFQEIMGRSRRFDDECWRLGYRIEGVLSRVGEWFFSRRRIDPK